MKGNKKLLAVAAIILLLITPVLVFSGGQQEAAAPTVEKEEAPAKAKPFKLAVVVPGVAAGSPLYEQLVAGAQKAVDEYPNASMKVVELGFNQAEWAEKMTSIVATGMYDAVISSNPSMPFVSMDLASQFPDQKFIFVDAFIDGHPQMASYLYNQVEQSYMLGHLAGLITTSKMKGANADLKIGIVVAQEYPALNKMMVPGFLQGAQAINPGITLDYRVVGNWYDANKAAELANSMIDSGVDVIGVICGGAAPGVFKVCGERNKYVMYWDDNSYAKAPGVIAGSGALHQSKLVYEVVVDAINGMVDYGSGTKLHSRDGYIEFVSDDPNYISTVPADIRAKQQKVVDAIMSGEMILKIPEL
ncbi:MAG: BMP family ABC transporter substrate-binding protein [Spirochaetales bacterium]|nr:BMP family ABC transporter substrate-binding protein [Spirochaetales bacterium]